MDAVLTYQLCFIFSLIFSNHAMFQVTDKLNETNWSEANKTCMLLGGRLPSGHEDEHFKQTISSMRQGGINETWISLRKRRLPIWTWLDGEPVDAEFAKQPWGDVLNCGVLHLRDALLEVDKCSRNNFGYLCELKAGFGCSSVEDLMARCIEWNGRAFLYSCIGHNWYQARYVCRKHKMDLPVIRNKGLIDYLSRNMYREGENTCMQVWIGLRRDDWTYNGQIGQSFGTKWAVGQPSHLGDCALLEINKENITSWKTEYCHRKHKFMCIQILGPGTKVSASSQGYVPDVITTDPLDSASNVAHGVRDPSPTSTYADGTPRIVYIVVPICVAILIAVIILVIFLRRHRRSKKKQKNKKLNAQEMGSLLEKDKDLKDIKNKPVHEAYPDNGIPVRVMKLKFSRNTLEQACVYKPYELNIKGIGNNPISHVSSGLVITPVNAVNTDAAVLVGQIYADMNRERHKVNKTFTMVTPVISIGKLLNPVNIQIPHKFEEPVATIKLFYKKQDEDEWQNQESNTEDNVIDFNMQRTGKYVCLADVSKKQTTDMSVYLFVYGLKEDGGKQTLYFYIYAIEKVHTTNAFLQGLHLRHPMASPDLTLEKAMRELPFELPKTYIRGCEILLNFVCDNTLWKVMVPENQTSEYKISAQDIKPDWKKDAGLPMAQYRVQSRKKHCHKFLDIELQMTVVKPSDKEKSAGGSQVYKECFPLTEVHAP